ncbi:phage tail domain-containing protein [Limosilactobacillus antri]|uniref:phage tail domain-containing protein n=1 Tax=Limosilactobacillus antri TaxID=227943 RepID=UPI001F560E9E|nr:phage tail domain-containing protein [Limosilactobacillus antri]
MSDDNIRMKIYRDWAGLNMTNSWWKDHKSASLENVEDIVCADLHFLDYNTNPSISNTYIQENGIDGSRFEYSDYKKTTLTLNFHLEFSSYKDFLDKKHDIQSYFVAKAAFIISFSNHPSLRCRCYTQKCEIKPSGPHDSIFSIEMDNPLGLWYSEATDNLADLIWEKDNNGNSRINQAEVESLRRDFRLNRSWGPEDLIGLRELKPGHNKCMWAGDVMMQMTNPLMDFDVYLYGCSNGFQLINHTTNTSLTGDSSINGDAEWDGLNLCKSSGGPINQHTSSTDFWIDPGENDIELIGANSAKISTRFWFINN